MTEFKDSVRVRIAPSPTGDPHVGTAYIALFNYVFAKKHGGKFILRIEDTDQTRFRASSETQIMETLNWLGLFWDEGPDCGGPAGPYKQSERLDIYKKHTDQLIASGHAYKCFCSSERLDELRSEQRSAGLQTKYDGLCRELSNETVANNEDQGKPFVVRLKTPDGGKTQFTDKLRGTVEFDYGRLDDQVLLKTDGFPTYHLANVVDDHLMGITHVIRAEEWISSTPKHVELYRAFGWQEPEWVHMPLLRNTDKSKISKRKNPVSLAYYRRAGILPGALVNFLSLMGWSFGDDKEIFSLDEMISIFDFKNVSLGGPVFDMAKLTWLNQHYMQNLTDEQFSNHIREQIFSDSYLKSLKPLLIERLSKFDQFVDKSAFFFNGALDYSNLAIVPKNKEAGDIKSMLSGLVERLDELYDWNVEQIEALMAEHKDELGWKPKDYFMTIRLIVTGRKDSPPLGASMEALGREIVRFRLRDAMSKELK
jgi:glutamyl-tRNA synthetase